MMSYKKSTLKSLMIALWGGLLISGVSEISWGQTIRCANLEGVYTSSDSATCAHENYSDYGYDWQCNPNGTLTVSNGSIGQRLYLLYVIYKDGEYCVYYCGGGQPNFITGNWQRKSHGVYQCKK